MSNFKNEAITHFNDGNQLYKINLFQEAFEQYSKAVEKDPVFYDAHFCIAKTYLKLGEFQKGIDYFKKYVHLIPGNLQSKYYLGLANILNSLHKNSDALQLIENSNVSVSDDNVFGFATILLSNNKYDKAIHLIINSKNKNAAIANYFQLLENENIPKEQISKLKNENIIPAFYEQVRLINEISKSNIQNQEVEQKLIEAKEILKNLRNSKTPDYLNKLNETRSKTEEIKNIIYEKLEGLIIVNPLSSDTLNHFNTLKSLDYDSEKLNPFAKIINREQGNKQNRIIKIASISVIGLLIIIGALYFALKDYPKRDAKKLAAEFCDCYNTRNEDQLEFYNTFLNDFDNYHFKKQSEARNSFYEKNQNINSNLFHCLETVESDVNNLKVTYKNYEVRNEFENEYQNIQNDCSNPQSSEQNDLIQKIEDKIKTIQDPTPDIGKIKEDLIGKKITGWDFDYLSEFKDAKILNQTDGSDRIEYNVYFKLLDEAKNSEHECEARVVYNKEYDGWNLENVKMVYITYIIIAEVNRWIDITILKDCTYRITDNNQRYWINDGSSTYKGGPGGDQFFLNSSKIYIMSREDHPVKLTFKYKSKEFTSYDEPKTPEIISKKNNEIIPKKTETKTKIETEDKLNFTGNWTIENENSSYYFYSNGTGNYKNSRGRQQGFSWTLNGDNLRLVMNNGSTWLWKVTSFSNNRIEMYNSSQNIHRTITKK